MKELSRAACAASPSATMAMDVKFKEMKAAGIPVFGFAAGEPDFDTPDNIKEAGIRAIREGKTKYTPAAGLVSLRKAIALRMKEDLGLSFDPDAIVVSNGAKACLYTLMLALLNSGDEVIVPGPYWVSYTEQISLCGGVPVVVMAGEEQGFKITAEQLEAAVTEKTKAFILNNPCNPTGAVYSREELRALADVCVKHDIFIVSDEVYYRLCYDGREFVSMASLGEEIRRHSVVVNGVSKSYAMTGWRCGFALCGDQRIARVMSTILSHSMGSIGTMNQYAAEEAMLGPQESVFAMREVFEQRRNYIVDRINAMDGVHCLKPVGAFYVMMNIERLLGRTLGGRVIRDADDFAMAFLEKGSVAVVSGCAFGAPHYVRWAYAASMENIVEGMDRLEKFLGE